MKDNLKQEIILFSSLLWKKSSIVTKATIMIFSALLITDIMIIIINFNFDNVLSFVLHLGMSILAFNVLLNVEMRANGYSYIDENKLMSDMDEFKNNQEKRKAEKNIINNYNAESSQPKVWLRETDKE